MFQFRRQFEYFVHVLFISLVSLVIYHNFNTTLYIFNGWTVDYSQTNKLYFLFGFILSLSLFYILIKNASNIFYRNLTIFFLTINIFIRIIMVISIESGPAGDAWSLFEAIVGLNVGSMGPFLKGGYISTYVSQLGGLLIMSPIVKIFEYDFNLLIFFNAFLLSSANVLIVLSVKNLSNWKNAFLSSFLLTVFMPIYFYSFMVYIEPYGLLLFGIIIYIISKKEKENIFKDVIFYLIIAFSITVRINLQLFLLSLIIYKVLFSRFNKRNIINMIILVVIMFSSNTLLVTLFNKFNNLELGKNSIPFSTTFAQGTSGTGFSNEYINFFYENDFDVDKLNEYNMRKISNNLESYFKNGTFLTFLESKFIYSWTDQDFDSMNYMLPNNFNFTFEDFKKDNSLRLGRAVWSAKPLNVFGEWLYRSVFRIRDLEKVMYFMTLFISLFLNILNFKKQNSELRLVLEMFVLGTTIVFLFVETQPRYLLMSYIAIIVQASLLLSSNNHKDDKIVSSEDLI